MFSPVGGVAANDNANERCVLGAYLTFVEIDDLLFSLEGDHCLDDTAQFKM